MRTPIYHIYERWAYWVNQHGTVPEILQKYLQEDNIPQKAMERTLKVEIGNSETDMQNMTMQNVE